MFIKIKKDAGMLIEHNGLKENCVSEIEHDLLLNLDHVAEITFAQYDQDETQCDSHSNSLLIPSGTRVIHFLMSYPYAKGKDVSNQNQRAYYKLYFPPNCRGEYEILRVHIDRKVCNI